MIRQRLGRAARSLLAGLPRSELLYRACQGYVDRYRCENNSDMHTNGELRFLRTALSGIPDAVVFDVGANEGVWARACVSFHRGAALHCFEPCRESFERLSAQVWPAQVRLNDFALGAIEEERLLYTLEARSERNSFYPRHQSYQAAAPAPPQAERVRLRTLDGYCREAGVERVDLLKVDVEGHELEVFQGGRKLFQERRVSLAQFEYSFMYLEPRVQLADLFAFVEEHGYRLYKIGPGRLHPAPAYHPDLENFRHANYVAASPDFPGLR